MSVNISGCPGPVNISGCSLGIFRLLLVEVSVNKGVFRLLLVEVSVNIRCCPGPVNIRLCSGPVNIVEVSSSISERS